MPTVLGQDRAISILNAALESGRFHHAWIFSGQRGVGKFTTAIEIARILLDPESPRDLNLIGDHESDLQRRIDTGTHGDLHIIRKELARYSDDRDLRGKKQTNIPIGLLRELIIGGKVGDGYQEAVAYRTALHGHGKVFIIDEAELLDETGQNSMLKTLEEPPAKTYFFLITNKPNRLLPTVRSRCQHLNFADLDATSTDQIVRQKIDEAKRGELKSIDDDASADEAAAALSKADRATIAWAMQFANGSPGIALLAIAYGFHQWHVTLAPMLAELDGGKFPVAMGETLGNFVEDFAKTWVSRHGKSASKEAANKDGARYVFSLLSSHARLRLAQASEDADLAERWMQAIDLVREAERQLESNVNQKLLMENLAVQWWQSLAGELV